MESSPLFLLLIAASCTNAWLFRSQVCYDDVGCFADGQPFDNTLGELPDSPDDIQVRTLLWTKQNPTIAQELNYHNISSIKDSNFDASRPTKVLIHGFMSNKDKSPAIANLSIAFLKMDDFNVIGVDWSKGAAKFYPKAVANTRVVGAVVTNLLRTLVDKFQLKVENLHVLGHSLGAHVAGHIGTRISRIARITGLDPAGPMFAKSGLIVRLDPTDAVFVDVIHSDGAPLEEAGFGTVVPMGHLDFYPNGGQIQPGCPPPVKTTVEQLLTFKYDSAFDSISCAHDRAIWYFIESVLNTNCNFVSYPCSSWSSFQNGTCNSCDGNACPIMGINAVKFQAIPQGSYYLKTNSYSPFCVSR